jgi:hypothetical protein
VQYLLAASGGLLGDVSRMLCDAAEQAIADGSEAITLAHLDKREQRSDCRINRSRRYDHPHYREDGAVVEG